MRNLSVYFQPTIIDPFIPKSGTVWRHTKTDNLYVVTGWARHTEDGTILVIYERVSGGDGSVWARPEKMWDELVAAPNGQDHIARRFEFVSER